jgi:hypothetical protein
MRARSAGTRKHAGWAAVLAFAGALTAVTVLPAHAADGYTCESGSYKSGLGRLGAFGCGGTGSTNVFVSVSDVVISGTGTEGPGTFSVPTSARAASPGVPGHWAGDCG